MNQTVKSAARQSASLKAKAAGGALLAALVLAGCVSQPIGPSITAMPGSTKNFDQFRADDHECRDYATEQIGGSSAQQAANDSAVKSAVIGTAIGALAGAAIGGHGGAGVGAAGGLIVGSAAGANAGERSGYNMQRRYDAAYTQCMYAKGERVPVAGRMEEPRYAPPPPPAYYAPPAPPPGSPPPPPPGYR